MLRTRGIFDLMPVSPTDGARNGGRERRGQREHRQGERAENLTHAMRLAPDSLLAEIAGWPEHVRLFQAFVAACRVGGGADLRARPQEAVSG